MNEINYLDLVAQKTEQNEKEKLQEFLNFIDNYSNKTQYARIHILTWDEEEFKKDNGLTVCKYIQGRITGGNLNISGTSTVRRNGSLSLVVAESDEFYKVEDIDNLLSLNKKIKIEIGIDLDILPFGELQDYQIYNRIWFPLGIFVIKNPSLNKSVSGTTLSLTISDKMCLLNGEMSGNLPAAVVFSEMDAVAANGTYTKEYPLVKDIIKTIITQYGGITKFNISDVDDTMFKTMKWAGNTDLYKYAVGGSYFLDVTKPEGIEALKTYKPGENIGMTVVPFTWPGNPLTANVNDTITSVLDKIKTLGDYEYFFDVDGKFIWQKKKTYTYGEDGVSIKSEDFFNDKISSILPNSVSTNIPQYDFTNKKNIIISYSNNPQYNNIKNDYIIWGKRKISSGAEMPIRYRLTFDEPIEYNDKIDTMVYYYKYLIAEPNIYGFKVVTSGGIYTEGTTPDLNKYYTKDDKTYIYDITKNNYVEIEIKTREFSVRDNWRTLLYFRGKREEAAGKSQIYFDNPIYKDLEIEWPKLYDMETNLWRNNFLPAGDSIDYYCHILTNGQLNKSSVGRYLTKVLNDSNINCVYFQDIDNNLILRIGEDYSAENKYDTIRVSDEIYSQIYTGGSQNSAFEQARQQICQNTSYANTISISCIPIYYIEPNSVVKVEDAESGIKGNYIINTISMPLAYNGNMTISASKAITIQ